MTESSPASHPLLVLGDDGSPPSDRAWRWIRNHPWPGWQVDILTADVDESHIEWGEPPRASEWTPTWERPVDDLDSEGVRFLTVATDPRAMLANAEADLVVVGMRTGSHFDALVTGSTTEWLLHDPPAPLAVVRSEATIETVSVCVDGSSHAGKALECFASLPLAASTEVTVLSIDDGRTDSVAAAESAAARLTDQVGDVRTAVVTGKPTSAILEHLESASPQLVVLGTRGLTGWKRLRLGSTAAAVVRAAPCTSLVSSVEG